MTDERVLFLLAEVQQWLGENYSAADLKAINTRQQELFEQLFRQSDRPAELLAFAFRCLFHAVYQSNAPLAKQYVAALEERATSNSLKGEQ